MRIPNGKIATAEYEADRLRIHVILGLYHLRECNRAYIQAQTYAVLKKYTNSFDLYLRSMGLA